MSGSLSTVPIGFEHAALVFVLPLIVTFASAAALFGWARYVAQRHPTLTL